MQVSKSVKPFFVSGDFAFAHACELKHTLREHGCLVSAKRGRPRIYDNDDARKAALKEQQRLCRLRHAQRLKDACAALARSSALENIVAGDK